MGPEFEGEGLGRGWRELDFGEGNVLWGGAGSLEPLDEGGVGQRVLACEGVGGETAAFELRDHPLSTGGGFGTSAWDACGVVHPPACSMQMAPQTRRSLNYRLRPFYCPTL